ncbi:hypothetical protein VAR608DRAFT_4197 [Variovorax sp. HW608]|uniref:hypothetical protein n=1 Tax=Variovorax sp. HW608 TaxID=1034889 RepID=UPI00081F9CD0|nr:hypothetical protein [Variovorax sp. HW608]SCK43463.1 hypothetical protein VAR608DRAFT_4197 [Variovorax sp. HW608]
MRPILLLAAAAVFSTGAIAQSSDAEHATHHPSSAAAKPASPKAQKPAAKSTAPTPSQMNMQMKAMEEMHAKMLAAKTPEERQALMADHMKIMHDGMAMMGQMRMGKPGSGMGGMSMEGMGAMHGDHDMMSRRMDMMEHMMQMMIDRESIPAPATK